MKKRNEKIVLELRKLGKCITGHTLHSREFIGNRFREKEHHDRFHWFVVFRLYHRKQGIVKVFDVVIFLAMVGKLLEIAQISGSGEKQNNR